MQSREIHNRPRDIFKLFQRQIWSPRYKKSLLVVILVTSFLVLISVVLLLKKDTFVHPEVPRNGNIPTSENSVKRDNLNAKDTGPLPFRREKEQPAIGSVLTKSSTLSSRAATLMSENPRAATIGSATLARRGGDVIRVSAAQPPPKNPNYRDPLESRFEYDKHGTMTLGSRRSTLDYIRFPRTKARTALPVNRLEEAKKAPDYCKQKPGRNYTTHPIVVVGGKLSPAKTFHVNGYSQVAGFFNRDTKEFEPCDVPCTFTGDKRNADVIFGATDTKCPLQKAGLWSMESEIYYRQLTLSEDNLKKFQIIGTTRLNSDVPALYGDWWEYDFYKPLQPKTEEALAVVIISNCGAPNGRLNYLQDLMDAGLKVHSMGGCKRNTPMSAAGAHWGDQKINAIAPYKFYLSFENTNVDDYITEKFFQSLVAGAVPVVYGVPNAKDFAPSPHSFIDTADFKTPAALVEFLKYLDQNDDEYYKYLSWKREGVSKQFEELLASTTDIHFACRVCQVAKRWLDVELGEKSVEEVFPQAPPVLG